ncbi:hypothetical protein [Salinispora arenicola]|uniref:hypothetical protein n=1 Tax=Salinispora arenicola TaxID=168697 RepID=UPI000368A4C7|nr:hypothetical protein [Salinispora arenicola]
MSQRSLNALVDRYIATWNEPEPDVRRKMIDELWAEDGTYYNRLFVCQGRDMVEAAISTAYREHTAKGFTFKSRNDAYGHHGGVKFGWVLAARSTGEVDTFGEEFLILDGSGRIVADYQFGLRPPTI